MIKIGTIPYIDGQVEASNRAGRSRDVFLVPEAGGWKPRVEGFADGSLPPADPDFGQALRTVRRFIRRNGGSAYKQPRDMSSRQRMRAAAGRARERSMSRGRRNR